MLVLACDERERGYFLARVETLENDAIARRVGVRETNPRQREGYCKSSRAVRASGRSGAGCRPSAHYGKVLSHRLYSGDRTSACILFCLEVLLGTGVCFLG